MRRKKDAYFGWVVAVVVAVSLGGIYVLTTPSNQSKVPAAPAIAPANLAEILQVSRIPENDQEVGYVSACAAFKVRNVSRSTVATASITVVLLDRDRDEISRFKFSVGTAWETECGSHCDAPLRPGEYCIHVELLWLKDYRRIASFTVMFQ